MGKLLRHLITHGLALALGFGLGVYFLPILTAAPAPDGAKLAEMAASARFTGTFTRDLRGSDFLHWGEGTISLSDTEITHQGKLAPGPDYKLYLTKGLVDHEDGFNRNKAVQLGDIKSFSGFILSVPKDVDISKYDSVLVWCESFGEFITAASYR
ncbi:MAG: DM13 domain-containing protein [Rhodobacteraceae bacterium]|nr:DM13 domain-containing protein [Paracoccaceae bacterium]